MSSDGIRRLGPFEGFIGALVLELAVFVLVAAVEELRSVFWRLIGFKGIRGGSISVPFTCGDASAKLVKVVGFQYEVE